MDEDGEKYKNFNWFSRKSTILFGWSRICDRNSDKSVNWSGQEILAYPIEFFPPFYSSENQSSVDRFFDFYWLRLKLSNFQWILSYFSILVVFSNILLNNSVSFHSINRYRCCLQLLLLVLLFHSNRHIIIIIIS